MRFLVILAVSLSCVLVVAEACSCIPSHPQEQFCRADFAIRARVIEGPMEELPAKYPEGIPKVFFVKQVYTVRITKIYKGRHAVNSTGGLAIHGSRGKGLKIKIYTPSKANSCNVKLRKRKVYVLTGSIYNKKLNVAFCNFAVEWSQITKKQRSGFARKFHRSCDCKVAKCYGAASCSRLKEKSPRQCTMDVIANDMLNNCARKYQYCRMSSDGQSCEWTTNSLYRKCLSRIP